jgi:hypothetical protein
MKNMELNIRGPDLIENRKGESESRTMNHSIGLTKYVSMCVALFTPLLIAILAGNILYLYFGGWWRDPNQLIEYTEATLMVGLVAGGVFRTIHLVIREWRRKPEAKLLPIQGNLIPSGSLRTLDTIYHPASQANI